MPLAQAVTHPVRDLQELRRLADLEGSVARKAAVDHVIDAPGARRHHHHTGREEDGLGDRMGDEDDGLAGLVPEPQQLLVELVAHDLVERAEGLIHQQEMGVEGESAGDRGALLHAARELPGKALLESREVDELEITGDPLLALLLGEAHDLERQRDVPGDGAPRIEGRRLEHVAIGPAKARLLRGEAVDRDLAARRRLEVGDHPKQGGLAASRRADQRDELAALDRQIDMRQRLNRLVGGLEGQGQIGNVDDPRGAAIGRDIRLRRNGEHQRAILAGALCFFHSAKARAAAGKGWRETNLPRPGLAFICPPSNTISPRERVVRGRPVTFTPSKTL